MTDFQTIVHNRERGERSGFEQWAREYYRDLEGNKLPDDFEFKVLPLDDPLRPGQYQLWPIEDCWQAWVGRSTLSGAPGQFRAQVMSLYQPPFRHEHGYIFDANGEMVSDDGHGHIISGVMIARTRGWGRISKLANAETIQDEMGDTIAAALNMYYRMTSVEFDLGPVLSKKFLNQ